jgi:hypothetical protein
MEGESDVQLSTARAGTTGQSAIAAAEAMAPIPSPTEKQQPMSPHTSTRTTELIPPSTPILGPVSPNAQIGQPISPHNSNASANPEVFGWFPRAEYDSRRHLIDSISNYAN